LPEKALLEQRRNDPGDWVAGQKNRLGLDGKDEPFLESRILNTIFASCLPLEKWIRLKIDGFILYPDALEMEAIYRL
jgi:hypothetical protein